MQPRFTFRAPPIPSPNAPIAASPDKDGTGNFIDHPARVARIVAGQGGGNIAVAAAYPHDTVENTGVTDGEIRSRVRSRDAGARGCARTGPGDRRRDERRRDHRNRVAVAGPTARLVYLAQTGSTALRR